MATQSYNLRSRKTKNSNTDHQSQFETDKSQTNPNTSINVEEKSMESNSKNQNNKNTQESLLLPLKVTSHRKHNSYHHPKEMLNSTLSNDSWYISAMNPHFNQNKIEPDWIIFKLNDKNIGNKNNNNSKKNKDLCIQSIDYGIIQGNGYIQDVQYMSIEIGDYKSNEWINVSCEMKDKNKKKDDRFYNEKTDQLYVDNMITLEQTENLQTFKLQWDADKIGNKKYSFVRVRFWDNFGAKEEVYARYVVRRFGLYGSYSYL